VAQQHHARPAGHVLLGREVAAEDRRNAEEAEEVRGHEPGLHERRLVGVAEDALAARRHGEVLEQTTTLAVVAIVERVERR
jgi:hypothetical protein